MGTNMLRGVALAAVLAFSSVSANAAWIQVTDPDLSDTATNPGFGSSGPANQTSGAVAAWLQNLLNLSVAPVLIAFDNDFDDDEIEDISSTARFLTLFYDEFRIGSRKPEDVTLAFTCSSSCGGDFDVRVTKELENYRIFRPGTPPTTSVPEPATLSLLGLGLVGLGLARRRRKSA